MSNDAVEAVRTLRKAILDVLKVANPCDRAALCQAIRDQVPEVTDELLGNLLRSMRRVNQIVEANGKLWLVNPANN